MKQWLTRTFEKYQKFMYGRYGTDELSRFMSVLGLVFLLLALIKPIRLPMYLLTLCVMTLNSLRTLSKNIWKRQRERNTYLKIRNAFINRYKLAKDRWKDRKTYRYYKCPKCKAVMRIKYPGFNHKITVRCARCGNKFDKRTL